MRSVLEGLRSIANFSGRSSRKAFWPYAFAIVGATMVAWTIPFFVFFTQTFARMNAYALAHPERSTITAGPGTYRVEIRDPPPELMPDFQPMIVMMALMVAVVVPLLAAAVTRRLHDRGLTGWMGLLPVPFIALSLFFFRRLFASFLTDNPDMMAFGIVMVSNLAYLATLAGLVFLLAQPGQKELNRYGPPV